MTSPPRQLDSQVPQGLMLLTAGLLGGGLLPGLAAAKSVPKPEPPAIVWPQPPDPPRLAYVQSIRGPSDLGVKRSALGKLAAWVTGESKSAGALIKPFGLSVDAAGNLCVTDTGRRSVCYFDARSRRWLEWTKAGSTKLISPVGVAKLGDTLYVVDSELGELIGLTTAGKVRFRTREQLMRPVGVAVGQDRVWVADALAHAIIVFDSAGRFQTRFGQRGTGPGEFNYPTHLALDTAGQLYVTDSMNCRVQVMDGTGKFRRQIGSIGDGPGRFARPKGVAVNALGHVYVADALFDNVQIFDRDGRLLLAVGQAGQAPGEFGLPAGVAIAADGRILIADCFNGRIQVLRYLESP